jgi:DnaJ-class molecular chaperone
VTALAAEVRAPIEGARSTGAFQRLFEPSEVTLEDSILGVWEALEADTRAECPVCHGELETSGCKTCGSQLT